MKKETWFKLAYLASFAIGCYCVAIHNAALAFIFGGLAQLLRNQSETIVTVKELRKELDVYKRYIERLGK